MYLNSNDKTYCEQRKNKDKVLEKFIIVQGQLIF